MTKKERQSGKRAEKADEKIDLIRFDFVDSFRHTWRSIIVQCLLLLLVFIINVVVISGRVIRFFNENQRWIS
jgi:hypothetical protein